MIHYEQLLTDDYTFNIEELHKTHHKKKEGKYYKRCLDILTFDIEVTSAWIDEAGNVIGYEKGKDSEYWNSLQPLALCYIWQFSINDKVYYGRELRDFTKVLDTLDNDTMYIIWVHNLAYEFQFLNGIMDVKQCFARSPHKPIYAIFNEYPNITFRCSLMLTNLSLASWGKQIGLPKMVGDLDYLKVRTPLTPLTDVEMGYCKRDCEVVYAGIKDHLKQYTTIYDIPMTSTGKVRKVVKEILTSDPEYVKYIKHLVPKTTKQYRMLQDLFAGGYTHANRLYSGQTVEGDIRHNDFNSSYPFVLCSEKMPSSSWVYVGCHLPDPKTFDKYAYIIDIEYENIECITFNTYIQASKCDISKAKYDNGRVLSAERCRLLVTELDYQIIEKTYRYKNVKVHRLYRSLKQYMPKPFIEYVLKLYNDKTTLKGVKGMEDIYMLSKTYINSLYGMCVTSLVQSDIVLDGDLWIVKPLLKEEVQQKLNTLKRTSPYEKRYFLNFSWGIWTTSAARFNLWTCMQHNDMDSRVIYGDTDSLFYLGKEDFTWYNNICDEKLKKMCKHYNIDFNLTRPVAPDGVVWPLGHFSEEDTCDKFKTLGAKRYIEERDNKLFLTVSGINKEAVNLLNDIEDFKDGVNFDKDAECVNKRLLTYINDMPTVTYPDGYISTYTHGINMRNNGYKLTLTDEYSMLIKYGNIDIDEIQEHFNSMIRKRWKE